MIVTDLSMTGVSHVYFNSAFIRILSGSISGDISFIGEQSHCENLKPRLTDINIRYDGFSMKTRLGAEIFLQDFKGCFLLLKLLFKTQKNERIFILNRLPFTFILCNLVNLILKRQIYNVMHGELEYLVNPKATGLTKYYYKFFKFAYILSTSRNCNIFLGQSIYDEATKAGIRFGKSKNIIIDHPYDYNIAIKGVEPDFKSNIKVGMIGTAMRRKNSHYMATLSSLISNKEVSVQNIGRAEKDLFELLNTANVSYFTSSISGNDYERMIQNLDYSLCFYDSNINLALASGSFLDSIKFTKPILALKGNPYVDYYFRKLGNIGYQFDDLKSMAEFINKLSNSEITTYKLQVEALKDAQKVLSIENITHSFQTQYLRNV